MIDPLRGVRRALCDIALVDVDPGSYITRIKAIELEAERLAQEALFTRAPPLSGGLGDKGTARRFLALYQAHLGEALSEAALEVLVKALGIYVEDAGT